MLSLSPFAPNICIYELFIFNFLVFITVFNKEFNFFKMAVKKLKLSKFPRLSQCVQNSPDDSPWSSESTSYSWEMYWTKVNLATLTVCDLPFTHIFGWARDFYLLAYVTLRDKWVYSSKLTFYDIISRPWPEPMSVAGRQVIGHVKKLGL